jgi:hypothetical protein
MSGRSALLASIVLAIGGFTAVADPVKPGDKKLVPVQSPVTATCDVFEIWGAFGKGGADPAIPKRLAKRLDDNLKFTEYKLLANNSTSLEKKKAEAIKLKKGGNATITLVEIVDKSNVRLNINFKGVSRGTVTVAGGDWHTTVAKESNKPDAEGHVLAVGNCK